MPSPPGCCAPHEPCREMNPSIYSSSFLRLFLRYNSGMDHDREAAVVPLDKEVFTDVTLGGKHEVDLLMRARFRGEEAFFLLHVENQSTAQGDFPKRMFRYFARLTEKYDLPVYPVSGDPAQLSALASVCAAGEPGGVGADGENEVLVGRG